MRLELVKISMKNKSTNPRWQYLLDNDPFLVMNTYQIRVVFDDEEIRLPFCESNYCTVTEFVNHLTDSLELDVDIDKYCAYGRDEQAIKD